MLTQLRSLLCEYHYDPLDRLTSHAQPNTPVYQRFYCKSRLANEIQGALRNTIFQSGDQVLGQQQRHGDSIDVALLATDQQRSVLQTLQKDNLPQPIAYSPYGHHRAESGLSSLLGFNGERADPVTGHYLLGNGYRAFNPVLMRFNSPDSWSPFGKGGLNAYAYCVGNPIGRTDPTGHVVSEFLNGLKYRLANRMLAPYVAAAGPQGRVSKIYKQVGYKVADTMDLITRRVSGGAGPDASGFKLESEAAAFFQQGKNVGNRPFIHLSGVTDIHKVYLDEKYLSSVKNYSEVPHFQRWEDLHRQKYIQPEVPYEHFDKMIFAKKNSSGEEIYYGGGEYVFTEVADQIKRVRKEVDAVSWQVRRRIKAEVTGIEDLGPWRD